MNRDRSFLKLSMKHGEKSVEIYPMLLMYGDRNIYFEKNIA